MRIKVPHKIKILQKQKIR